MTKRAQDNFRKRVKVWIAQDDSRSVAALAKTIGRRRDTVSKAIHQPRFPRVREQIEKVIA